MISKAPEPPDEEIVIIDFSKLRPSTKLKRFTEFSQLAPVGFMSAGMLLVLSIYLITGRIESARTWLFPVCLVGLIIHVILSFIVNRWTAKEFGEAISKQIDAFRQAQADDN